MQLSLMDSEKIGLRQGEHNNQSAMVEVTRIVEVGGFGIREDNGGRGDDRRSHGRGRGKTSFIIDNDVVAAMIDGIGRRGRMDEL